MENTWGTKKLKLQIFSSTLFFYIYYKAGLLQCTNSPAIDPMKFAAKKKNNTLQRVLGIPVAAGFFGAGGHRRAAHAATGLPGPQGIGGGESFTWHLVNEREVLSSYFWSLEYGLFLSCPPTTTSTTTTLLHVGESARDFTIRALIKKHHPKMSGNMEVGTRCSRFSCFSVFLFICPCQVGLV